MTQFLEPLKQVWRSLWLLSSCLLCVAVGIVVLKLYEDTMRTRERGRLVSSIVDQQFHDLQVGSRKVLAQLPGEYHQPENSLQLKRWITAQSLSGPEAAAQRLRRINGSQFVRSATMRTALNRWHEALVDWTRESQGDEKSPAVLFREAKERYYEAAGYREIGESYGATVLQLWSISLLTQFVDRAPFDPQIPEALFMLGISYMTLGPALPPQMRGDRILNLCSELYPDSLWADRATQVWRKGYADEI